MWRLREGCCTDRVLMMSAVITMFLQNSVILHWTSLQPPHWHIGFMNGLFDCLCFSTINTSSLLKCSVFQIGFLAQNLQFDLLSPIDKCNILNLQKGKFILHLIARCYFHQCNIVGQSFVYYVIYWFLSCFDHVFFTISFFFVATSLSLVTPLLCGSCC